MKKLIAFAVVGLLAIFCSNTFAQAGREYEDNIRIERRRIKDQVKPMTLWRLISRSLVFYWRTNLGVLLAGAVGTAILTGASVKAVRGPGARRMSAMRPHLPIG